MENQTSFSKADGGSGRSYEESGVSIQSGNELVDRIKPHVASTARSGTAATIDGFGGIFSLPSAGTLRLHPS